MQQVHVYVITNVSNSLRSRLLSSWSQLKSLMGIVELLHALLKVDSIDNVCVCGWLVSYWCMVVECCWHLHAGVKL